MSNNLKYMQGAIDSILNADQRSKVMCDYGNFIEGFCLTVSPTSRSSYKKAILDFLSSCGKPIERVTFEDIRKYHKSLFFKKKPNGRNYTLSTIDGQLSIFLGFFRFWIKFLNKEEELLNKEEANRIIPTVSAPNALITTTTNDIELFIGG